MMWAKNNVNKTKKIRYARSALLLGAGTFTLLSSCCFGEQYPIANSLIASAAPESIESAVKKLNFLIQQLQPHSPHIEEESLKLISNLEERIRTREIYKTPENEILNFQTILENIITKVQEYEPQKDETQKSSTKASSQNLWKISKKIKLLFDEINMVPKNYLKKFLHPSSYDFFIDATGQINFSTETLNTLEAIKENLRQALTSNLEQILELGPVDFSVLEEENVNSMKNLIESSKNGKIIEIEEFCWAFNISDNCKRKTESLSRTNQPRFEPYRAFSAAVNFQYDFKKRSNQGYWALKSSKDEKSGTALENTIKKMPNLISMNEANVTQNSMTKGKRGSEIQFINSSLDSLKEIHIFISKTGVPFFIMDDPSLCLSKLEGNLKNMHQRIFYSEDKSSQPFLGGILSSKDPRATNFLHCSCEYYPVSFKPEGPELFKAYLVPAGQQILATITNGSEVYVFFYRSGEAYFAPLLVLDYPKSKTAGEQRQADRIKMAVNILGAENIASFFREFRKNIDGCSYHLFIYNNANTLTSSPESFWHLGLKDNAYNLKEEEYCSLQNLFFPNKPFKGSQRFKQLIFSHCKMSIMHHETFKTFLTFLESKGKKCKLTSEAVQLLEWLRNRQINYPFWGELSKEYNWLLEFDRKLIEFKVSSIKTKKLHIPGLFKRKKLTSNPFKISVQIIPKIGENKEKYFCIFLKNMNYGTRLFDRKKPIFMGNSWMEISASGENLPNDLKRRSFNYNPELFLCENNEPKEIEIDTTRQVIYEHIIAYHHEMFSKYFECLSQEQLCNDCLVRVLTTDLSNAIIENITFDNEGEIVELRLLEFVQKMDDKYICLAYVFRNTNVGKIKLTTMYISSVPAEITDAELVFGPSSFTFLNRNTQDEGFANRFNGRISSPSNWVLDRLGWDNMPALSSSTPPAPILPPLSATILYSPQESIFVFVNRGQSPGVTLRAQQIKAYDNQLFFQSKGDPYPFAQLMVPFQSKEYKLIMNFIKGSEKTNPASSILFGKHLCDEVIKVREAFNRSIPKPISTSKDKFSAEKGAKDLGEVARNWKNPNRKSLFTCDNPPKKPPQNSKINSDGNDKTNPTPTAGQTIIQVLKPNKNGPSIKIGSAKSSQNDKDDRANSGT
ncbi:MAG: hypothetical protein LBH37_00655 [Oscillospiraceae bacterium]|nr:hypothetical protein [Oscillospiraceae bacterium]